MSAQLPTLIRLLRYSEGLADVQEQIAGDGSCYWTDPGAERYLCTDARLSLIHVKNDDKALQDTDIEFRVPQGWRTKIACGGRVKRGGKDRPKYSRERAHRSLPFRWH
jgi:hypothetical protein